MKRSLMLFLIFIMLFAIIAGCSGETKDSSESVEIEEPDVLPDTSPSPTESQTLYQTTNYRVNAEELYIRSSADNDNMDNVVGSLKLNDVVKVVDASGDFYTILMDDGTLDYVYGAYLVLDTGNQIDENTNNDSSTSDSPYYIYIEKASYTMTIYEKDDAGNYTIAVKTYKIAHGGNKTPAGTFTILAKERWHSFKDGGCVQYACRYHNRLYLHSALYATENPKTLWPKYYNGENGIGKPTSGGCLRMVCEAAKFIYDNCPEGTVIEIVNGAPKGTTSSSVPALLKDKNGNRLRIDPTDSETLEAAGY